MGDCWGNGGCEGSETMTREMVVRKDEKCLSRLFRLGSIRLALIDPHSLSQHLNISQPSVPVYQSHIEKIKIRIKMRLTVLENILFF